jgi:hypothetical protein
MLCNSQPVFGAKFSGVFASGVDRNQLTRVVLEKIKAVAWD